MVEPTCVQLNKWKTAGNEVKFIRMDNAGENKALQTMTESSAWKFPIEYELLQGIRPNKITWRNWDLPCLRTEDGLS
jgi:hypothetical protein